MGACEKCCWSLVHETEGGALFCHRYPPQVLVLPMMARVVEQEVWPSVSHDDFCGEFQPTPTEGDV